MKQKHIKILSALFSFFVLITALHQSVSATTIVSSDGIVMVYCPYPVFRDNVDLNLSQKIDLDKEVIDYNSVLQKCLDMYGDPDNVTMKYAAENLLFIYAIEANNTTLRAEDYVQNNMHFGSDKLFLKVKINDDQIQYSNKSIGSGNTITSAKVIEGFYTGKEENTKALTRTKMEGKEIHLAESYYVKRADNGTESLQLLLGERQMPLRPGHTYIIQLACRVIFPDSSDSIGFEVFLFDEECLWDIDDLAYRSKETEQLTSTGLYKNYRETQYPYARQAVGTFNRLMSQVKRNEGDNSDTIKTSIVALTGVTVVVVAVLIPVIFVSAAKKRKAKKKPLDSAPQDQN